VARARRHRSGVSQSGRDGHHLQRPLALGGKLPYLDSVEVKPPGAFVLLAPVLWLLGLRGVWALGVVWGTLTSLATGALAKACYGDRWGRRVALLHAAASVIANDADINYSFWMVLPLPWQPLQQLAAPAPAPSGTTRCAGASRARFRCLP